MRFKRLLALGLVASTMMATPVMAGTYEEDLAQYEKDKAQYDQDIEAYNEAVKANEEGQKAHDEWEGQEPEDTTGEPVSEPESEPTEPEDTSVKPEAPAEPAPETIHSDYEISKAREDTLAYNDANDAEFKRLVDAIATAESKYNVSQDMSEAMKKCCEINPDWFKGNDPERSKPQNQADIDAWILENYGDEEALLNNLTAAKEALWEFGYDNYINEIWSSEFSASKALEQYNSYHQYAYGEEGSKGRIEQCAEIMADVELWNAYETAKKQYDEVDYPAYEAAKKQYDEVDYPAYEAAKKQYEEDLAKYTAYQAALAKYNEDYAKWLAGEPVIPQHPGEVPVAPTMPVKPDEPTPPADPIPPVVTKLPAAKVVQFVEQSTVKDTTDDDIIRDIIWRFQYNLYYTDAGFHKDVDKIVNDYFIKFSTFGTDAQTMKDYITLCTLTGRFDIVSVFQGVDDGAVRR